MKVNEFELENLPETLSMEQILLICHVSKLTARFYVKSGLIKNKNSGKQTRCYSKQSAQRDFLPCVVHRDSLLFAVQVGRTRKINLQRTLNGCRKEVR